MGYKYDIFISYRRDTETQGWINKHFLPLLNLRLGFELGRKPLVYIDEQLEFGTTWPVKLGQKIGVSKTLISLWTKNYLNSVWCTCEMSHMIEREKLTSCRTPQNPNGLILPIIIHDGETLPIELSIIQKLEIQDCFNVRMSTDSPKAEKLDDKLSEVARSIADSINNVPPWQNDWNIRATNDFYNLYYQQQDPDQNDLPKFAA